MENSYSTLDVSTVSIIIIKIPIDITIPVMEIQSNSIYRVWDEDFGKVLKMDPNKYGECKDSGPKEGKMIKSEYQAVDRLLTSRYRISYSHM